MVTVLQLQAFIAVADTGSFEAAGRHLSIAQSAVSRHIRDFELGFSMPLFDRRKRTARLTLDGVEVLARAREILRIREAILQRLACSDT